MSLSDRAALFAVLLVLCGFLATTNSSPASKKSQEQAELIDLLKKLRNALEKEDETKTAITEFEDNVNERHDWTEEILQMKAQLSRKGSIRKNYPATTLLQSEQQTLLDNMNSYRRAANAANMYQLQWNDKLAGLAQEWSNKCKFKHGSELFDAYEIGFPTVGQTIYAASIDSFTLSKVVSSWNSMKRNYDARADNCNIGKACGAYKQLVSGYTTDVGCGMNFCQSIEDSSNSVLTSAKYIVCFYGPPGSYEFEPTLILGTPCTKCKGGQLYCNNGLCNSNCTGEGPGCTCSAASCQRCGTVTTDCRCNCVNGTMGVDCADLCADQLDCKQAYAVNSPTSNACHKKEFDFVKKYRCQKSCGNCVTVTGDPPCPSPSG